MEKIYKVNPEVVYNNRNGVLKLIYLDDSKNDVVTLNGPVAEALPLFDGKQDLKEIKRQLDQKFSIKEDDGGFDKMISFLIKNGIILEA